MGALDLRNNNNDAPIVRGGKYVARNLIARPAMIGGALSDLGGRVLNAGSWAVGGPNNFSTNSLSKMRNWADTGDYSELPAETPAQAPALTPAQDNYATGLAKFKAADEATQPTTTGALSSVPNEPTVTANPQISNFNTNALNRLSTHTDVPFQGGPQLMDYINQLQNAPIKHHDTSVKKVFGDSRDQMIADARERQNDNMDNDRQKQIIQSISSAIPTALDLPYKKYQTDVSQTNAENSTLGGALGHTLADDPNNPLTAGRLSLMNSQANSADAMAGYHKAMADATPNKSEAALERNYSRMADTAMTQARLMAQNNSALDVNELYPQLIRQAQDGMGALQGKQRWADGTPKVEGKPWTISHPFTKGVDPVSAVPGHYEPIQSNSITTDPAYLAELKKRGLR